MNDFLIVFLGGFSMVAVMNWISHRWSASFQRECAEFWYRMYVQESEHKQRSVVDPVLDGDSDGATEAR